MIYEDQGVIVELTKDSVPILLEIDKVKAEYRDGRETVVSDGETLTIAPVNEADTDVHVNAGVLWSLFSGSKTKKIQKYMFIN